MPKAYRLSHYQFAQNSPVGRKSPIGQATTQLAKQQRNNQSSSNNQEISIDSPFSAISRFILDGWLCLPCNDLIHIDGNDATACWVFGSAGLRTGLLYAPFRCVLFHDFALKPHFGPVNQLNLSYRLVRNRWNGREKIASGSLACGRRATAATIYRRPALAITTFGRSDKQLSTPK